MIGRLTGKILAKQAPMVLLDVNGVGYEVFVPMNTFYQLPVEGQTISLHTHFVVREDAQILYGFYQLRERELFRMLIKINGVGPKMALAILSGISLDELIACVAANDVVQLTRVPGVGRKTAERLLVEMRDKLANWEEFAAAGDSSLAGKLSGVMNDASSALVALGYKAAEATKLVKKVYQAELSSEELIRLALREATGRG